MNMLKGILPTMLAVIAALVIWKLIGANDFVPTIIAPQDTQKQGGA